MTQQVVSPQSSREPTPNPSRSLRWALAAWILGMVLIQGLGASTKDRLAAERDYFAGTLGHRPADIVRAVRAYLADANDMRRYYAYANAFLGKPYYAYYVRSAASWNAEFRSGEPPQKEDGTLRPDNNAVENSLHSIAIGKRNWLFAGSDQGAEPPLAHAPQLVVA